MSYVAKSENLTHVGDAMGRAYSYTNWRKYFYTLEEAIAYCDKDYNKQTKGSGERIKWIPTETGQRTQDLGFVMYHIDELIYEE